MSCDEVRRALPLLRDHDPDEEAAHRAHAAACSSCAELFQAYATDERALVAYASVMTGEVPAMVGFADAVMSNLDEPEARTATVTTEERSAKILRPSFLLNGWLALAAGILMSLGLTFLITQDDSPRTIRTAQPEGEPTAEPLDRDLAPTPMDGVTPVVTDPLPSPNRLRRRGPRMRSARRGIGVPVDSNRRRRRGMHGQEFLNALQRFWSAPASNHAPPLRKGEREVSF